MFIAFASYVHILSMMFASHFNNICIVFSSYLHRIYIVFSLSSHRLCIAVAYYFDRTVIVFASSCIFINCHIMCIVVASSYPRHCIVFSSYFHNIFIAVASPVHRVWIVFASPLHRIFIVFASICLICKLCTYDSRHHVFIVEILSSRVQDIFNQLMKLLKLFKPSAYDARNNFFGIWRPESSRGIG